MAKPWERYANPQGIPIGMQDPAMDYRGPKAALDVQAGRADMANDAARLRIAQNADARAANAEARAAQAAEAANQTRIAAQAKYLTPAQQAADTAFGKDYAEWVPGGGSSSVDRQLNTLESQIARLKNSDTITGPIVGRLPKFARQMINPDSINAQDTVEEAIQGSLKQILGAQFTQQEGERLLARAYNPTVDEDENIRRVSGVVNELRNRAAAKNDSARYFETTGSLKGWQPNNPLNTAIEAQVAKYQRENPGVSPQQIETFRRVMTQRATPDYKRRLGGARSAPRKQANDGWKIERLD